MEPVSRKYIPKKLLFDTRMIDRNLRDGIISREEYEEHQNKLVDSKNAIAKMDIQFNSLVSSEAEGQSDTEIE